MVHMNYKILGIINPFISFLHVFKMKKGHNIFVLMLDLMFKNLHMVSSNLGGDKVAILVAQYNELLLLPLLVEYYKFLKPNVVEEPQLQGT